MFSLDILLTQLVVGLFTVIASIGSSVGFWTFFSKKKDQKSASTQLLRGLAHQKIISQGSRFIERGWVTIDEYDDFIHYLYNPYLELGGNGLAERIYSEVKSLPVRRQSPTITEIAKVIE